IDDRKNQPGSVCGSDLAGSLAAWLRLEGVDDPAALADGQNLVGLDLGEAFELLRRRPFDFDQIRHFTLSESKVEPEITLRHDAGAAVHLGHLDVFAGDDA